MDLSPHNLSVSSGTPRLVGREREYALLRDRLDAAMVGAGGLVLLSGEAGIGKTSLAAAIGQEAAARGAVVMTGRCYDHTETPPYGLWIDLFSRSESENRRGALPPAPPTFVRHDGVATIPNQVALFNQVREYVQAATAMQPAVMILDDLHWSDPASLDLLRSLARSVPALPLLVVAAYRSDSVAREHPLNHVVPLLVREADADRTALERLTEADLSTYVSNRYDLLDTDTTALVQYLHARTEGNPFFVTEVLQALEDEKILWRDTRVWALGDVGEARIPLLLRQVIDTRLQRLGADAQHLLSVAALIGHDVPLDLWRAVSGADEGALLDLVEHAVAARVLEERTGSTDVHFVHALIREALLDGILAARRRVWHREIANVLLAMRRPNAHTIAYHLAQAGDARATEWLTRAGEEALCAFAWVTATERFRAALDAMDAAEETGGKARGWLLYCLALALRFSNPRAAIDHLDESVRIADAVGDRVLRAGALFQRGSNRYLLGEVAQGLAEMTTSVDLLDELTADERALLDPYPIAAVGDCRGFLTHYLAWSGRATEALRRGELSRQSNRSPGSNNPSEIATGTTGTGLGIAYATLGDVDAARVAFARSCEAYARAGADLGVGFTALYALIALIVPYLTDDAAQRDATARAGEEAWRRDEGMGYQSTPRVIRLPLLVVAGAWDEARALAEELCARPLPATRQLGASLLGPLARAQGDGERARELVRAILPDDPATEPGAFPFVYMPPLLRLAATLAQDADDHPEARAWLETHDRWLAWNGAVLGRAEGQLGWAEYHRAAGDRDAAVRCTADAMTAATQPRQPLALLAAHRLAGELATDARRFEEAAMHHDTALTLADACAAPYERALTLLAQAELRAVTGARVEARALLDAARAIFTSLGATPALARAGALAARVAARSSTHPTGLTQREIEVLRLLAAGHSNRAIGNALRMSVRTAERHLNNIYVKTNARGRADATAFALRHGLAEPSST